MHNITGAEEDVLRLFNPQSVAVIGASSRAGTLSWWPLHLLQSHGFKGEIFPINPTRDSIEGLRCYPSIQDLPKPVDLAIIALSAERTVDAVRECADLGVKSVVLPSQGFSEIGAEGAVLERQLAALARPGGLRIVGPNTDGVANLAIGAIASIQPLFDEGIEPGPVGLATQSGATGSSVLVRLKRAGLGCGLYASAGNEIDLGLVDYMSVMVQDPSIKIIVSFVEGLRRPREFLQVAELAADLGKPIVLIKVGRSEQGARRAAAHTGALAGADDLCDAMFASRGVIRVSELSELVAVAKLFLSRGAPKNKGVGIISVSGGQAGAVADKVSSAGLDVPNVSAATETHLNAVLKFGKGFNPCDLTGEVARDPTLAKQVYDGFDAEPDLATIIYVRKHLTAAAGVEAARQLGISAMRKDATSLAIYAMDGVVTAAEAEHYEQNNIPIYDNLNDLCVAVDGLADYASFRQRRLDNFAATEATPALRPSDAAGQGVIADRPTKRLLGEYCLRFPEEVIVTSQADATAAAERIGYPVVLKIVSDRIPHKTEAGGVALGLRSVKEVQSAYERVVNNARSFLDGDEPEGVLVQEQVDDALEMIVGLKVDPTMGPFVLVGLGGVMTELLKDIALRPAPVDSKTAREMLLELRGAPLLQGFRGAGPRDIDALSQTIANFSRLAAEHASWLQEGDLNPVLVLEKGHGVRVVDALLVAKEA